jgi:glycerophosphoryl diester phosphodiesterase
MIACGKYIFNENANNSIFSGMSLCSLGDKKITSVSVFGIQNTVYNDGEFACGINNASSKFVKDGNDVTTLFSIGGNVNKSKSNCIEVTTHSNNNIVNKSSLYVYGIGGYNGANASDDNTKSLQQVISDIETAVSLNSNGPWDVDITSEFINGNVTIKPLSMWTYSQDVKRVYFLANLKQGDVITIPDTLRMYIGWKISDNRFGMADWNKAGKKYTVTVDSNYVILLDTPAVNAPGVQTNTLPSFGKIMLRTSNPEFKPTAQTDAKKDHANDDKVMRGIAHQGFHKLERANSLAAFRAAAKEGWRYVETDTYMTKDGKFIVSHDDNVPVGYTNGAVTLTDRSYKYGDHTLADILAFHGPNGEKVDTLEEFCQTCKECGLHPYIEIKQGMMWQGNTIDTTNPRYNGKPYAIKLLDIVNRYGLRGNATFISSTAYTLRLMADKDQSYRYGIVYFGKIGSSFSEWTTLLNQVNEFNTDAAASKAYLFADVNIDNLKTAEVGSVDKLAETGC